MSKNDGGQAFPYQNVDSGREPCEPSPGMSLRDWFAGQALASIAAHDKSVLFKCEWTAESAYKLADAMLAARSPAVSPDKDAG